MVGAPYWAGSCIQSSEEHVLVHPVGEQLNINFRVEEECSIDFVHVLSIPNTNLYFLVIHGSESEVSCEKNHIFSFEVVSDTIALVRTCLYLNYVPIPCIVSKFSRILPSLVYFVSFFYLLNI